jgi:hypothetical protein
MENVTSQEYGGESHVIALIDQCGRKIKPVYWRILFTINCCIMTIHRTAVGNYRPAKKL